MSDFISEHVFIYPFQWYKDSISKTETFTQKTNLNGLVFKENSVWQHVEVDDYDPETYNEKNYFYFFVHPALYEKKDNKDNTILYRYERVEPKRGDVFYEIKCRVRKKEHVYKLLVKSITLDYYSTGIGVLKIHVQNKDYNNPEDVLYINQFGRRIYPPFANDVFMRFELAVSIALTGLDDESLLDGGYKDDFSGYAERVGQDVKMLKKSKTISSYIVHLINGLTPGVKIESAGDDRMFVASYYRNDLLSQKCENGEIFTEEFWYMFLSVAGKTSTGISEKMKKHLLEDATYSRWQAQGTLYGITRYSFQMLTKETNSVDYLTQNFVSVYVRFIVLLLVQRSSVLRFSEEVTSIIRMHSDKDLNEKADSVYKEYIRFVNQIYFREVTAQEQGIDFYQMLSQSMQLKEQIEKLDEEISEVYKYVSLCEDRKSNDTMSMLTWIAAILGTLSTCFAFFSMTNDWMLGEGVWQTNVFWQIVLSFFVLLTIIIVIMFCKRKK